VNLLQITYNNQRVAVELVTYWDSCKEVSHILGSVQRKKPLTRSSPIGDWSKGSTVGGFFGIGLIVVRFLILVTACSWLVDFWE